MNRGTKEGTIEEIELVKLLNNKSQSAKFWQILKLDKESHFAVHVIKHQLARVQGKMIKPKADIYIAKGFINNSDLESRGYLLNEDDIEKYKLTKVERTGISVKMRDSKKYQILKTGPEAFRKIFGSYELGAAASLYCLRKTELKKNKAVLIGWKTNKKKFIDFYIKKFADVSELFDDAVKEDKKIVIAKKIKNNATSSIYEIISKDKKIADYVFKGVGNFDEPFTAYWIFEADKFRKLVPYDFRVTTGSGRSKGDFTIVIKPK